MAARRGQRRGSSRTGGHGVGKLPPQRLRQAPPCVGTAPAVQLKCRPPANAPANPPGNINQSCPAGFENGPLTPVVRADRARDVRIDAANLERNRPELNPPRYHPRNTDETLPKVSPPSPAAPPWWPQNVAAPVYGRFYGSFTKGLPHDDLGEVREDAYCAMLRALQSGDPGQQQMPPVPMQPPPADPNRNDFENIPLGCPPMSRKLENPQASLAFSPAGADSHALFIPPPPDFASEDNAAEMAEIYWMALSRDVPFTRYATASAADFPAIPAAVMDLAGPNRYAYFKTGPAYRGTFGAEMSYLPAPPAQWQIPGVVAAPPLPLSQRNLFRGFSAGDQIGPYVSQLLLRNVPYGSQVISGQIRTLEPQIDFLTSYDAWLEAQDGCDADQTNCDTVPRFIRNGRDLGQYVHVDMDFNAFYNAAFLLFSSRDPLRRCEAESGLAVEWARCLPYNNQMAPMPEQFPDRSPNPPQAGTPFKSSTQLDVATFGPQHLVPILIAAVHAAFTAVWFQKWAVHRRLRPEEFGGRVHNRKLRAINYPIHNKLLNAAFLSNAGVDPRVNIYAYNRFQNQNRRRPATGSRLCNLAPPPGMNVVPPCSGNGLDGGTYLLPMEYAEGSPLHPAYGSGHATAAGACATILKAFFPGNHRIQNPMVASEDGLSLVAYTGPDADDITVEGEINKLASNIALGRNFAGVHWRSDYTEAIRLGECVAISMLEDYACLYNEDFTWRFRTFDGNQVVIARRAGCPRPR
jgi:hypothetical protein